nr:MAG: ORF3 [Torque teno polar bear virus 22]
MRNRRKEPRSPSVSETPTHKTHSLSGIWSQSSAELDEDSDWDINELKDGDWDREGGCNLCYVTRA